MSRTKNKTLSTWDWKFWAATVLAIIGLVLTIEDRPTVSLGSPTDAANILSTPVTIVNNGILPIRNVYVTSYVKHSRTVGGFMIDDLIWRYDFDPLTTILRPGEPRTTDLSHLLRSGRGGLRYAEFDMALLAHFSPVWMLFWKRTRVFRFTVEQLGNGNSVLKQVPAENIDDDYREALKRSSQ